jgi:hypothetical protein
MGGLLLLLHGGVRKGKRGVKNAGEIAQNDAKIGHEKYTTNPPLEKAIWKFNFG